MRKRILFRKAVCSLLALLLALSSLMVLPVLAEGEVEGGGGDSAPSESAGGDTGSGGEAESSGDTGSGGDADTNDSPDGDTGANDPAPSGETTTNDTPSNEDTPAEPAQSTDAADNNTTDTGKENESAETGKQQDETTTPEAGGDQKGTDADGKNTPDEDKKPEGEAKQPDNVTLPDGKPAADVQNPVQADGQTQDVQQPETATTLETVTTPEIAAVPEIAATPEVEEVEFDPISIGEDGFTLRTFATDNLQASLSFSGAADKAFTLRFNGSDDCHFYDGETDITAEVSIESAAAADGFIVSLKVPFEFLENHEIPLGGDDEITFAGQTFKVSELELPESLMVAAYNAQPAYDGITIDGNFDDWAGVAKTDVENPGSWKCKFQSAVVWDGDYVYIYFRVNSQNAETLGGLGTHGNGKFGITTDLNRNLMIKPIISAGAKTISIEGIDDAQIAIDNFDYIWQDANGSHCVEIAIPTSRLPEYNQSINFGFYLGESFLTNIVNLNPVQGPIQLTDLVCDGLYDDWRGRPVTEIQYDTAGIQEIAQNVDGYLQLASVGRTLYGHVYTTHPDHQNAVDLSEAITIRLNNITDYDYQTHPRLIQVNSDGSLNWEPDFANVTGTQKYLAVDTCGWHDAKTLDELYIEQEESRKESHNFKMYIYGYVYITIDKEKGIAQTEFQYDIPELARKADVSPESVQISAQYGRIGQEWASCAGTPTGPILGLALCFATVGGVYAVDRKKKKK